MHSIELTEFFSVSLYKYFYLCGYIFYSNNISRSSTLPIQYIYFFIRFLQVVVSYYFLSIINRLNLIIMYLNISFSRLLMPVYRSRLVMTEWINKLHNNQHSNDPVLIHPEKPRYQRINIDKIRGKM